MCGIQKASHLHQQPLLENHTLSMELVPEELYIHVPILGTQVCHGTI